MSSSVSPKTAAPSVDVVVVGSINADQVVRVPRHPKPGETLLGSSLTHTAGGKGANQAVAAALQGARVAFVGAYGCDAYADVALEFLRSSGVDLAATRELDTNTGFAAIQVSDDGENSIVVVPGANEQVDAAFVSDNGSVIDDAAILLLQGEVPASGFAQAVDMAVAAGRRVVVNLAPVIEVDREALLAADPLMVNEHEGGLVLEQLGLPVPAGDAARVAALLEAGFASVVMTLGARGALVASADAPEPVAVASPKVTAVDTTGAGDCFAGAFVAHMAAHPDQCDLVAAAEHAVSVAAFSVQHAGAQVSYPDKEAELPC